MSNGWQAHQYAEWITDIEDRHIERIEMVAKKVFEVIVLPVLKRYNVSFITGNGTYLFYRGKESFDIDELAEHGLTRSGGDRQSWTKVRDAVRHDLNYAGGNPDLGLWMPNYDGEADE